MNATLRAASAAAGIIAAAGVVFCVLVFEPPGAIPVQHGYRGTGLVELFNPKVVANETVLNKVPAYLPQLPAAGVKAGVAYKNVQVLGDVSVGQFTRLMVSFTNWVAPQQGCNYCHVGNNFASDDLYTKVVARKMIQMVQHINVDWKSHVANTGVTCYTCHRGQPVPAYLWFNNPGPGGAQGMAETNTGKNLVSPAAAGSSLPYDPFTPFLEQSNNIRVQGTTALPAGNDQSIKQTEWTYALMMHFSQALGVNCTYCHNTRSFGDWSQSTPQRETAWYGIRMARDLNNAYLESLASVFPHNRLGPYGDVPKVDCATCHQGVYKPLFGVSMAKDFPELGGVPQPVAATKP
jgi:photosynthetic reaction center cytochrome c subunit